MAQWLWDSGFIAPRHVKPSWTTVKPVSPALAGRFLATVLSRKSPSYWIAMSGGIPKLTTKWSSSAAGGAKEAGIRAVSCLHTALPSSSQSPPPGAPLTPSIWPELQFLPADSASLFLSKQAPRSLSTWVASALPSLSGHDLYGCGFTIAPASLQALGGTKEVLTTFGVLKFSSGLDD